MHLIDAVLGFGHFTYECVDLGIEFAVTVHVLVDFKDGTGQLIVGILFVHLRGGHVTEDGLIGEANACLVLHDDGFAVVFDLEIVVAVILEETFGRGLFIEEISVIAKVVHLIDAVLGFGHLAYEEINFGIEFAVAVHIHVDFKDGAGQLVVGVFLIHLGGLDRAGDELVLDGDLDDFLVRAYGYSIAVLVQYECRSRLDLTDDPSAEWYVLEGEDADLIGLAGSKGGFLSELGFVLTEETEDRTADGEAILVQLLADDSATDDLVGDSFAVIHGDLHHHGVLACILEGYGIGAVREDIVAVGCDLLDVYLRTYRQIGCKYRLAVLVAGYGFNETVLGDDLAVSCSDVLSSEKSKLDGGDLVISTDAVFLVLFQDFGEVDFHLLSFVDESCGGGCDLDLLSGVGQLYGYGIAVKDHTVGCCDFTDFEFAEEQRLGGSRSVCTCGDGGNDVVLLIAERTVEGYHIFGGSDLIDRACQALDLIHGLICSIGFHHSGEDLTGLGDGDRSFLRFVFLDNLDDGDAVFIGGVFLGHVKVDRSSIEDVTVGCLHLDK